MLEFDGAVAGIGTASGTRLVIGMWPLSPFGSITDVMIEKPDGHRVLIAPTQEMADFITAINSFDEVRVAPVLRVRDGKRWMISSTPHLALSFEIGRRAGLGWAMSTLPRRLARARRLTVVSDPIARTVLGGVRTRMRYPGGRRQWFSATDMHVIKWCNARFDRQELGDIRPVTPPVRFGIGSTPEQPALVRVLYRVTAG